MKLTFKSATRLYTIFLKRGNLRTASSFHSVYLEEKKKNLLAMFVSTFICKLPSLRHVNYAYGLIVTISNADDPRRFVSLLVIFALSAVLLCDMGFSLFIFTFLLLFSAGMWSIGWLYLRANLLLHTFFRQVVAFYLFFCACKFVDL